MKTNNKNFTKKASVYYRNNKLHEINDEFIKLTGYKNDDIAVKSLIGLSQLLKINNDNFCKDDTILYKGYIFTNEDVAKHVEITCEKSDKETIYYFKEFSSEFLDGLLSTCNDGHKDDIESIAIYSYPDLVCLKANTNYNREWHLLNPEATKNSNLVGTIYSPLKPELLINIKEKGYHYVDESELTDKEGNTRYWAVRSTLIYEKGKAKYLKNSFIQQTEKVITKITAIKQKWKLY